MNFDFYIYGFIIFMSAPTPLKGKWSLYNVFVKLVYAFNHALVCQICFGHGCFFQYFKQIHSFSV